jgi:hypothetical protein
VIVLFGLIFIALLLPLYIYLNIKLVTWCNTTGVFKIQRCIWRLRPQIFRSVSTSNLAISAALLILLYWFANKLGGATELGWIIWWWCCVAFSCVVMALTLLIEITKFAWKALGSVANVLLIPASFAFSGWIWFCANEASNELNTIFSLPGKDFPAALTALTFMYSVAPFSIGAGVLAIVMEILFVLVFILDNDSKKMQAITFALTIAGGFVVAIFAMHIFILPVSTPMRQQVATYLALKYDFDDATPCQYKQDKASFKFVDLERKHLIVIEPLDAEVKTIKNRNQAVTIEPMQYFRNKKIVSCAYTN